MKKKYIQPSMKDHKLNVDHLLEGLSTSNDTIYVLSKKNSGFYEDFDDFDEEDDNYFTH